MHTVITQVLEAAEMMEEIEDLFIKAGIVQTAILEEPGENSLLRIVHRYERHGLMLDWTFSVQDKLENTPEFKSGADDGEGYEEHRVMCTVDLSTIDVAGPHCVLSLTYFPGVDSWQVEHLPEGFHTLPPETQLLLSIFETEIEIDTDEAFRIISIMIQIIHSLDGRSSVAPS